MPSVAGYPAVTTTIESVPGPLPTRAGSVRIDTTRTVRPGVGNGRGARAQAGTTVTAAFSSAADSYALGSYAAAPTAAAAAVASPRVALRALVVAVDAADFGVATWTSMLNRVGASYDVLHTASTALTSESLVRPDGTGRYNAILLTNSMLLYQDSAGGFVSGLTADEWNLLWAYERDYGVRQATLYTSYGTFPEDYCLRARTETTIGDTPLQVALTATGAPIFDYLKSSAKVPVIQSYVYRTQLAAGCNGRSVLTAGSDVLGVETKSTDGRERMALTFTSNEYLLQSHLLTYGLFRWASRGLFLGEHRHFLNIDIDDWFNTADVLQTNGTIQTDPGYQVSGHDAYNLYQQRNGLRTRYPLASTINFDIAFNGGDAQPNSNTQCYPNGGVNRLTSTSRCLRNEFRWLNHTLTHPDLNFTDYATNAAEISQNFAVATQLGLPTSSIVVKTGEYSGLGVYNPDPNNDIDPPTDFGLGASNVALLQAAKDLGVRYLHGNMSFASHQPACFNCGFYHPLEQSVFVVPDWPTNIAYHTTTSAQQTYFYNSFYGPNGRFPFFPTNVTYAQMLNYETDQALSRVASGSVYSNTFHIANVKDYSGGKTLLTDWADRLLSKYSSYYSVPLLNPGWPGIATYAEGRNAHFAGLSAGVDAVYDKGSNTVTITSPVAAVVTITGAPTAGSTTYGSDVSGSVSVGANATVSFTPRLRP